ncbi:thioesterase domain-containing protein [Streptomyces sp. Ac-502]|uniref:thioesterase domain-containing protein n=1 Tax=Streptomyces sp. Ac-502 TaxID=3342801 RepID=UPI0038629678
MRHHGRALPGYTDTEPLAHDHSALITALAAKVRHHLDDTPYVLLAHSSGSWLAHLVAHHLAGSARPRYSSSCWTPACRSRSPEDACRIHPSPLGRHP